MELSIRDWMLVIGVLLLIAVVLDGYRKAQRERRNQVRLSRNAKRMQKFSVDKEEFESTAELPNGGPRVIGNRDVGDIDPLNPPEIKSERIHVQDHHAPQSPQAPEFTAPLTADNSDDDTYEVDPLFVDPFEYQGGVKLKEDSHQEQPMPSFSADDAPAVSTQKAQAPDEIIALNVLAVDRDGFSGEDLLHILLACDCRFGEMNIFHRYEAENAQGEIQFSIVNVVEPGIFDLDDIQAFSTPGVSFFIRLPGPKDPAGAFEAMIETAQCLVRNLNGSLRDEQNSTITEQTLEHLRERIRNYQARKNFSH